MQKQGLLRLMVWERCNAKGVLSQIAHFRWGRETWSCECPQEAVISNSEALAWGRRIVCMPTAKM